MADKILLVEDDLDFGAMLKQYLEYSDMQVQWYADSRELLQELDVLKNFDIAILDVMMPHMSGFKLAELLITQCPNLPILFLTAKDQKIDKLIGLKIGADDYITKPCDPEELVLRLHNIIRRSQNRTYNYQKKIALGQYTFDKDQMQLMHPKGGIIQLTEKENRLLFYLIQHKNRVITREDILLEIWQNQDFFSGRSMDVFVSRLRKYLQHDERLNIQSLRGIGFRVNF